MADNGRGIHAQISQFTMRMNTISQKIVNYSRGLVPVLQDAGQINSAKELERLLFEFDAVTQEAIDFAKDNLESILEGLIKGGPK